VAASPRPSPSPATGTDGAYLRRGPFDLLGFASQTVVIRFRAATDVSLVTTFRIDDVSVE
jgi:hypothetical protein